MAITLNETRNNIRLERMEAERGTEALGEVSPAEAFASVITEAENARGVASEMNSGAGRYQTITEDDVGNLATVMGHEVSTNTWKNYRSQWRRFCIWTDNRGVSALPTDPLQVAAYLAERLVKHGHKPATLQAAVAAIGYMHRAEGFSDPCEAAEVKDILRSARRMAGSEQRQAKGITDDDLRAIIESACKPRRWSDGRMESAEAALRRGLKDIALISTMRDGLLRVSEAAALLWQDIEEDVDGSGRLRIRRSKTDADGEGAVAFLSMQTMESLDAIQGMGSREGSVFGLMPNTISTRIKESARAAGLGEGYSGHSPRVGMARDLARAGTELTRLMTAGRWRSPRMPALYTRNETVARGAVAQYYGSRYRRTIPSVENKVRSAAAISPAERKDILAQVVTSIDGLQGCEKSGNMQPKLRFPLLINTLSAVEDTGIKALIHAG